MALAKDLMGAGFSAGQSLGLGGALKTSISAAGSSITDATDLTASKNVVTTATAGQGVQLASMSVGESQVVFNATDAAIRVYPGSSSAQINQLTAGAGATLPSFSVCEFHQVSSTRVLANLSA